MKKLTVKWVGEPKIIKTKFGDKQKFSIKAPEEGDKFLDVWLKPDAPIWKIGEAHDVEDVVTKEYTGKDGVLRTSHEVRLPKFGGGNAEVMKKLEEVLSEMFKIQYSTTALFNHFIKKEQAKNPPADDGYPTAESEGLDPRNMANFDHTVDPDLGPISVEEEYNAI